MFARCLLALLTLATSMAQACGPIYEARPASGREDTLLERMQEDELRRKWIRMRDDRRPPPASIRFELPPRPGAPGVVERAQAALRLPAPGTGTC